MNVVAIALICVAALLVTALLGVVLRKSTGALVYLLCLIINGVLFYTAGHHLLTAGAMAELWLPIGVPWTGAHFRIDSLSSFFLIVIISRTRVNFDLDGFILKLPLKQQSSFSWSINYLKRKPFWHIFHLFQLKFKLQKILINSHTQTQLNPKI